MNTTSNLASGLSEYYDRVFLMRALPLLLFILFGQIRPLPRGNSKKVKFRRYNSLAAATTPLTEGVTPSGSDLTVTDIEATVAQYGDFITITDMVDMTNPDPVLTEGSEVLGEQSAETVDELVRDVLVAGSSVAYSNGSARTDVNTLINATVIKQQVRLLKNNKAKKITQRMAASVGVGSQPLNSAYIGICSVDVGATITGLTGFKPVETYANQGDALPGEIGMVEEVRWLETTQAGVVAGGGATGGSGVQETTGDADVHQSIVLGANAYGVVPLDMNAGTIFKPLGSAGSADPINQRATLGWKLAFVAKILNDAFMTRIESAAAA